MAELERESIEPYHVIFFTIAESLRNKLSVSHEKYTMGALGLFSESNPRDYFLYGVLDTLEQTGFTIQNSRFVLDVTDDEELRSNLKAPLGSTAQRQARNFLTYFVNAELLAARKLVEVLVDVLLFTKTNDPEHYQHYLLTKALTDAQRFVNDTRTFHNCDNKLLAGVVSSLRSSIAELEKKIASGTCWHVGKGGQPSSVYSRFRQAMSIASADERICLGFSYNISYGQQRRGAHTSIGALAKTPEVDAVDGHQRLVERLGLQILLRCIELTDDPEANGQAYDLAKTLLTLSRYSTEGRTPEVAMNLEVGDVVMAPTFIGVITEMVINDFGNRACLVRPIGEDSSDPNDSDWWPAVYLKLWKPRDDTLARMGRMLDIPVEQLPIDKQLDLIVLFISRYLEFLRTQPGADG